MTPESQKPELASTAARLPAEPLVDAWNTLSGPSAELKDKKSLPAVEYQAWREIVDVARHCPSPHNVQPWIVVPTSETTARLMIDGKRTFPWTDHTGSFILSATNMFAFYLQSAAYNRGENLEVRIGDVKAIKLQDPLSHFADLELKPGSPALRERDDVASNQDMLRRMTSRKQNLKKPLPESAIADVKRLAGRYGHEVKVISDQKVIDQILRVDIRTLFADLNHRQYFGELKPYIKLGSAETATDGLHYQAMNLPRTQMAFMKHGARSLKIPGVDSVAEMLYRRQLGHCENLAFVSGKFWDRNDSLQAGSMLIRMWLELSRQDLHIHPFGNLVTNRDARQVVENKLGIEDMWFVFRVGYTDSPVKSNRLPVDAIVRSR